MEVIQKVDALVSASTELIKLNLLQEAITILSKGLAMYREHVHSSILNEDTDDWSDFVSDSSSIKSKNEEYKKTLKIKKKGSTNKIHKQITNKTIKDGSSKSEEFKEMIEQSKVSLENPVLFSEIFGNEVLIETMKKSISIPFRFPEAFTDNTAPHSNILLYGLAGNGKTKLALACAYYAKEFCPCTTYLISASTILNKYYGESEKAVKYLFQELRKNEFSILILDEVDQLLPSRNSKNSGDTGRVTTEFLQAMEGAVGKPKNVIILATTNRPYAIDASILSRFDVKSLVNFPDCIAREKIFLEKLQKLKHKLTKSEIKMLAEVTDGFSGRDLTSIIKKAWVSHVQKHEENWKTVNIMKLDIELQINSHETGANDNDISLLEEFIQHNQSCGSFKNSENTKGRPFISFGF